MNDERFLRDADRANRLGESLLSTYVAHCERDPIVDPIDVDGDGRRPAPCVAAAAIVGSTPMTPRKRRLWSKAIEESGIAVRVYERAAGSVLHWEVRLDGGKDRKSLGHRDWTARRAAGARPREADRRVPPHRAHRIRHAGPALAPLRAAPAATSPGRALEPRARARGVLPRPLRRRLSSRGALTVARRRVRARPEQRAAARQAPAAGTARRARLDGAHQPDVAVVDAEMGHDVLGQRPAGPREQPRSPDACSRARRT